MTWELLVDGVLEDDRFSTLLRTLMTWEYFQGVVLNAAR